MSRMKQDDATQRHGNLIAKLAHIEHFNPVGETVAKLWGVSANVPSVSASAFVVWTLHRTKGPLNENRIQKEIKKHNVYLGHKNIHDLLASLYISGFIDSVYYAKEKKPIKLRGYVLTEDMKKLIEANKPGEED